ncbi:MAG: hypothetical protein LBI87_08625 [Candidatus Accumulibacter sp.]|jgi:hypothetical protein|nr:hypothetical protein [Accumulibacter sp.]
MTFCICLAIVCICLAIEKIRLSRWLTAIPLRLHVYGTRGKTTTTRSLFTALKESDHVVLGKTTGDSPIILLPDGSERTLRRIGPASIRETLRCLEAAYARQCDAVVFECMAISPESIAAINAILSPTHLIVTNTRPDHYETMGATPRAIAETLALCVPPSCTVFATEDAGIAPVRDRARAFGNPFHGIPEKEQAPFLQSRDMVEAVARILPLAPYAPEPESTSWPEFRPYPLQNGGIFWFLDLFSANDVVSSAMLLEKALPDGPNTDAAATPLVALLATRPDRPLRTRAFVEWLDTARCRGLFAGHVAMGWHAPYAYGAMKRKSPALPVLPIAYPMLPPARLLGKLRERFGGGFRLVGVGNAHDYGALFRTFLHRRS